MPTTEVVERNLAVAQKGLSYARSSTASGFNKVREWMGRVACQEAELEAAHARDLMQATRPAGCWCLGFGGRWLESKVPEFCECEDGARARAASSALWRVVEEEDRWEQSRYIESRLGLEDRELAYTLDTFPVSIWTKDMVDCLRDWKGSLLLLGPPSIGKTGAAIAALHARCVYEVRGGFFITTLRLLNEIRAGFHNQRDLADDDENIFQRVVQVPYLVLDDLGKEHVTDWTLSVLFDLLDQRNRAWRPTIFTSNLSLQELRRRLTDANVDRIVEMCDHGAGIIEISKDTPNLRVRKGRLV